MFYVLCFMYRGRRHVIPIRFFTLHHKKMRVCDRRHRQHERTEESEAVRFTNILPPRYFVGLPVFHEAIDHTTIHGHRNEQMTEQLANIRHLVHVGATPA